MKAYFGLTGTLILLLTLLVVITQGSSYWVTSRQLQEVVRQQEIDKVRGLGVTLTALIDQKSAQTAAFAKLMSTNQSIGAAVARAQIHGLSPLAKILDKLFADSGLDLLEVTDHKENVLHRAHGQARVADRSVIWGVGEALEGTGGITTTLEPDRIAIRAIEPLRVDDRIVGTISAGGFMGEKFLVDTGKQIGAHLALLARTKPLVASRPDLLATLDDSAIRSAFEEKIPIYRQDPVRRVTRVYLPVLIVDEGFVVLAEIDSHAAYARVEKGIGQAVVIALGTLLGSVLIGMLAVTHALRPLRALRARAAKTAYQLSGSETPAAASRDEITSVVGTLDHLTETLLTRNRELGEAKAAAESASEAKSQFLSNMSHEIRTPLNGVLGMAELLQGTPLTAEQQKYCRAIAASGRTLHDLLSDILDLAKIEARKIQLERINFNPASLITDIADAYRELAASRGSSLKVDIDPALGSAYSGDPTRLRQVLSNIMGNAVKFTEGGSITLAARRLEARPGDDRAWLNFSVTDTGIGMSDDVLAKLFTPFVQADSSTTRNYGGTGLGLAICKHLVELMGGTVNIASQPGKGTAIAFDLPLHAATAPVTTQATTNQQKFPVQVLVAEDTKINQEVVRVMLTRLGATVTIVENGELAVEAARNQRFDIVFMDCQMPVMNGYQATTRIRAEQANLPRVPIVALTANALAEDRQHCIDAGMDDYMTKPVTLASLQTTLARWTR